MLQSILRDTTMPEHEPPQVADEDQGDAISTAIAEARQQARPIYITAGGTKRHLLGRACDHAVLDVSGHRGIVDYQPRELVITARAGTMRCSVCN